MEFHEFTQAIYPFLSKGETEGAFVRTLLCNIVSYEYPDNKGPYKLSEDTLRNYFNGERGVSKTARSILGHLNTARFEKYIKSFSDDAQQYAYEALIPLQPKLRPHMFPADCAEAFADCLRICALTKPGRKVVPVDANRNAIEEGLRNLITSLSAIEEPNSLVRLRYNAVKTSKKIVEYPNRKLDNLLEDRIAYYVVRYYRFIQEQIGLLEQSGALAFHIVAKTIQRHYESLKANGYNSVDVYFKMRDYIQETTKADSDTACEILVAFFVQNCEVFDAPAE